MMTPRVVILGVGFGGLFTALELARQLRKTAGAEILLLDAHNFHLFSPMLHEVTAGNVEPRHVVRPIRALGDCARSWDPRRQAALPPTAQVAVQQARCVARNIARELRGQDKQPFVYRHQGDLVSLGAGDGVGEIAGVQFSGLPAWLLWRAVFLGKLIGWKNRIRVALDWIVGSFFDRDISKLEW